MGPSRKRRLHVNRAVGFNQRAEQARLWEPLWRRCLFLRPCLPCNQKHRRYSGSHIHRFGEFPVALLIIFYSPNPSATIPGDSRTPPAMKTDLLPAIDAATLAAMPDCELVDLLLPDMNGLLRGKRVT